MADPKGYTRPTDVDDRASFSQRLQWRVETLLWDILYWFPVSLIGPERASNFGGWLGRKIGPRLSQHKTALANLRRAFPEWPDEKVRATALDAWENVGRTAGELPHLSKLNPYRDDTRLDVVNPEGLDAVSHSKKGAVLVSGHFANWEVMASAICNRPLDCLVTYRALNNPHIDRRLNALRQSYGIKALAPKGLGTRKLMKTLGEGRSVAFLNDQKFREGIPVPFFGHEAMTAPGPTRLAARYDVPIIPISTVRTGPCRFRVTVHEPIVADPENTYATVSEITRFIEDRIRETPGQWFWMHRRWPKNPPVL